MPSGLFISPNLWYVITWILGYVGSFSTLDIYDNLSESVLGEADTKLATFIPLVSVGLISIPSNSFLSTVILNL